MNTETEITKFDLEQKSDMEKVKKFDLIVCNNDDVVNQLIRIEPITENEKKTQKKIIQLISGTKILDYYDVTKNDVQNKNVVGILPFELIEFTKDFFWWKSFLKNCGILFS